MKDVLTGSEKDRSESETIRVFDFEVFERASPETKKNKAKRAVSWSGLTRDGKMPRKGEQKMTSAFSQ